MTPLRAIIATCLLACQACYGATTNFAMHGNFSPEFIAKAEQQAEHCRKVLAIEWLGAEIPAWSVPCRVELVPHAGAGGATFYGFDVNGKGFDFEGKWQGPEQGLLQDVIPHEVLHTVLSSHLGRVPRWADEGAAMNCETTVGTVNFEQTLRTVLYSPHSGGIPTEQLIHLEEYPKAVALFYGQSHSLVKFLLQFNGKRGFVEFLRQALAVNDYEPALRDHYGLTEATLQSRWLSWYQAGCPLSPDQIGIRSVSYQGPCRYMWNGRGWVQQCDQPQYQPQVRPAQPVNPAPIQPVPPKPAPPVQPSAQPPAKDCACGDLKSCDCTGEGKCECDLAEVGCKCDGKDVLELKAYIAKLEVRIGELEKKPVCKSCECNSEDDPATRPGKSKLQFDIKPRVRN